ncbi:MAG: hypothetical protein KC731_38465, partial [Myxococcales bacterium]|nr:hypothetical protein [Myxococcales bacterium]
GVPWQDIARRNVQGVPDLLAGLDLQDVPRGGLYSPEELIQNGTYDLILGDPMSYVPPADPLMRESIAARNGQNPLNGESLAPPGSGYLANSVNGHERFLPDNDDLQYTCIFPLGAPKDCSMPSPQACECNQPGDQNPLCQAPDGSYGTQQYFAKAYPGLRHLDLLESIGRQGVVGSICPAQTNDATSLDYGYRPVFRTLGEAASSSLLP